MKEVKVTVPFLKIASSIRLGGDGLLHIQCGSVFTWIKCENSKS